MNVSGDRIIVESRKLGDWVVEDVVVSRVNKGSVKIIPLSDCGGGGGCGKCNLCGPSGKKNCISYKLENVDSYNPGERIKLKRFIVNEALAAGTLFGIPIMFAFLTQLFWHIFSPESANSFKAVFITLVSGLVGVFTVFIVEQIIKLLYPAKVE